MLPAAGVGARLIITRSAFAHTLTSLASGVYLVTLALAPVLAPERDVLRSHPEDYGAGAAGLLVRLGYAAVAVAAWSIASIVWPGAKTSGRVAAVLALAAGLLGFALAAAPQEVTGGPLLLGVFALALLPAAASIAHAATLPSPLRGYGFAVTVAFLAIVFGPSDAGGLINRVWDGLVALWGIAFGLADRRAEGAAVG